ncbi:2-oxoacid:ferredoxin oxidoreductase subunit beta [bacterium]|nr:2-oxoacid:ferredoxin oxidoreductase subunit beta [bacterium]
MAFDYATWLRPEMMPHIWCPGCGIGIVLKSLVRSMDACGWDQDTIGFVSGIGCTSRAPGYVDMNTLHTTHGRALTFATGLKMAKPSSNVVVMAGDGDSAAIGGNHLIHACRRNIDITLIIVNNEIYGMTGGQFSPTTPTGSRAATAPYGNIDPGFDLCNLTIAAGATYVARGHVGNGVFLERLIKGALQHKGFSVVEVMSNCHTQFGRRNKHPDPSELVTFIASNAVALSQWNKLTDEEKEGKYPIGVLHKVANRPEYCESYHRMSEHAQQRVRDAARKIAEAESMKPKTEPAGGHQIED